MNAPESDHGKALWPGVTTCFGVGGGGGAGGGTAVWRNGGDVFWVGEATCRRCPYCNVASERRTGTCDSCGAPR